MDHDAVSNEARARASPALKTPEGILADRLRVWETRKFLQAIDVAAEIQSDPERTPPVVRDSAFTAFLRCLAIDLNADLAMASLLDDTTQFFLAGISKHQANESHGWIESPKWYGCNSILFQGGLCPQTLVQSGEDPIFEKLDLSCDESTRSLPVVNGQQASFRYYAGTPLITKNKLRVGTIFIFRNVPSIERLCDSHRSVLVQYAARIMAHLELSIQALDCTRLAKSNEAVAALTHNSDTSTPGRRRSRHATDSTPLTSADWAKGNPTSRRSGSDTYQHAAQLLLYAFDFGGVSFQEVNLQAPHSPIEIENDSPQDFLACETRSGTRQLRPLSAEVLDRLLICWPAGEVFHRINEPHGSSFMAGSGTSPWTDHDTMKMETGIELVKDFPGVQQLIYTPLWDSFHDRIVAIAFCWALDWRRVYTPLNDLFPLTAFCMAVMNLVRRKESQRTEQQKADFLGSISHEMRSPLHGNLANIELLLQTQVTEEQYRMLESASYSGQQLLDTIDKVLAFSTNSAGNANPESVRKPANRVDLEHLEDEEVVTEINFAQLAEDAVQETVNKSQTLLTLSPSSNSDGRKSYLNPDFSIIQEERQLPLILLDVRSPDKLYLGHRRAFQAAIINLLSNAIQYSSEGCVRVSVTVNPPRDSTTDGTVVLCVADCGIGMSHQFLQHRIFVPFMQEDQLNPGTGLGLALVKQAVESVQGQIQVKSDVAEGTTVTVCMPLKPHASITPYNFQPPSFADTSNGLQIHLCVPTTTGGASRQSRNLKLLYDSFACILRSKMGVQLKKWHSGVHSDLILVCENDLPWLDKMTTDAEESPRLVFSSRVNDAGDRGAVKNVLHFSNDCILPSQLVISINELLGDLQNTKPFNGGSEDLQTPEHEDAETQVATDSGLNLSGPSPGTVKQELLDAKDADSTHQAHTSSATQEVVRKPNVLLVDDNLINLKVLAMYIQKCAVAFSRSVPGGQEAVDAFQEAAASAAKRFDIVFMDLSMPRVSGFDATASIRGLETNNATPDGVKRALIVALTGLVSAKDRVAAFDAGVDDYITKPAKIADVKGVIDQWVRQNSSRSR